MLIYFEGIDGVGKSTQIAMLQAIRPDIIATKEPGGSELGERIREIVLNSANLSLRAEILLFLADRAEHYEKIIRPNQGKIIISDRGFVSGVAYALAKDPSLSAQELMNLNKFALNADLDAKFVFFKASRELIKKRLNSRGASDEIEKRGVEYLIRVQEIMSIILRDFEALQIDASDDVARIHDKIKEFL